MLYLKIYFAMLLCFFAIDLLWLGVLARNFYQAHLGAWLRPSPNWTIAIVFYLIYISGILVFVVAPNLQAEIWKTLLLGGFFGLVTYATYDLTNHATMKGWPWIVSVVDIAWGTTLCTLVALAGHLAGKWFS
ncbi:MAG: DUF2177 family protein [Mariniblastus sp.]|nr:DUF2177 family protein [Mariniblastus sp.]